MSSPALPTQFTTVLGLRTRHLVRGDGPPVLVLHGWGASIEAVYPIVTGLSPVATVHALDLPGFGESDPPPRPWGVEDYQAFVGAFMDALEIEAPTIVGHSNGGRIAIRMAATEPVRASRLVLVDSAGIRPKRTLGWYRRVGMAKIGKYAARFLGSPGERLRTLLVGRAASADYLAAGAMRPTLVKLVNADLRPFMPSIGVPTLLVWGAQDTDTPLEVAHENGAPDPRRGLGRAGGGRPLQLPRSARPLRTHRLPLSRPAGRRSSARRHPTGRVSPAEHHPTGRVSPAGHHATGRVSPAEHHPTGRGSPAGHHSTRRVSPARRRLYTHPQPVSAFEGVAAVLAILALGIRLAGRQHRLLHLLQLEHYEGARLMLWLRKRGELIAPRELIATSLLFAAAVAAAATGSAWLCGALLLASCPLAALGVGDWRRGAVKPLVFTGRAKRLLAAALLAPALLALATIALAAAGLTAATLAIPLALGVLLLVSAPWTLLTANRALGPLQSSINRRYEARAERSLREWDPLVVGITGSFGKTTTKFCVGAVLEADRPTLVTPESYNSFLGVVRTINEHLRSSHRAFVVEMGMFRRGDIAELCDFVHPTIGVITAIGPMHLERLGSIEAIAAAKGELLDALPPEGHFITNADDPRCLELAVKASVPVTLFGSTPRRSTVGPRRASARGARHRQRTPNPSPNQQASSAGLARDVRLADGRTTFKLLLDGPDSPQVEVSARLLGLHNVANLLAAAAGRSRARHSPVPHRRGARAGTGASAQFAADPQPPGRSGGDRRRLQLKPRRRGRRAGGAGRAPSHPAATNERPAWSSWANSRQELNRRFGEQAAAVCDIAILVGPARTAPIREGLASAGMAPPASTSCAT